MRVRSRDVPRTLGLLVLGVVAVAFSAILIRLTDAPPMTVALYRNAIAAAILLPVALARHRDEIRSLTRRQWGLAALAGVFLAAHFATWIPSLDFTTVAASTVLVTTQPLWVAAISLLRLRERLSARGDASASRSRWPARPIVSRRRRLALGPRGVRRPAGDPGRRSSPRVTS